MQKRSYFQSFSYSSEYVEEKLILFIMIGAGKWNPIVQWNYVMDRLSVKTNIIAG